MRNECPSASRISSHVYVLSLSSHSYMAHTRRTGQGIQQTNKQTRNVHIKSSSQILLEKKRKGEKEKVARPCPRQLCHSNTLVTNPLHHTPSASRLDIGNSTLQRAGEIGMEQRPIEPVYDRHRPNRGPLSTTTAAIGLAALQLLGQIAAASRAGGVVAVRNHVGLVAADAAAAATGFILRALALELLFVLVVGGDGRGAVLAANVGDAEDGLPALKGRDVALPRGREAEAGGGEGPLGPAVVDAGEVPVHRVRGGVAVQLVADIDEVLDGGDVDVVDRGEVEDDGFEGRFVGFDGDGFAAARAGVVPGAILSCCVSQCYNGDR